MRYYLILLCAILCVSVSNAQVTRPQKSPFQKLEQRVGLTDVTLQYCRPSAKGREIFGGLVKYGETWRTGANLNTLITFSRDVEVKGQAVAKGTYSIYTVPNKDSWDFILYSDTTDWGVPDDMGKDKYALHVTIPVDRLTNSLETLTIGIDDVLESTATLSIAWETSSIRIPIEFHFNKALEEIATTAFDKNATEFHVAAVNYHERDLNLEQAREWMEKAIYIREQPHFWDYLEYSVILHKLGEKKEALAAAEKSLELAQADGGDWAQTAIQRNKVSIAEWTQR